MKFSTPVFAVLAALVVVTQIGCSQGQWCCRPKSRCCQPKTCCETSPCSSACPSTCPCPPPDVYMTPPYSDGEIIEDAEMIDEVLMPPAPEVVVEDVGDLIEPLAPQPEPEADAVPISPSDEPEEADPNAPPAPIEIKGNSTRILDTKSQELVDEYENVQDDVDYIESVETVSPTADDSPADFTQ